MSTCDIKYLSPSPSTYFDFKLLGQGRNGKALLCSDAFWALNWTLVRSVVDCQPISLRSLRMKFGTWLNIGRLCLGSHSLWWTTWILHARWWCQAGPSFVGYAKPCMTYYKMRMTACMRQYVNVWQQFFKDFNGPPFGELKFPGCRILGSHWLRKVILRYILRGNSAATPVAQAQPHV